MTTPAAERLYLAQHLYSLEGRNYTFYNPRNKPFDELPVIYGFNNGGSNHWYQAVLLAEDGTGLGGHVCSHEGYMEYDLGVLNGTRLDRHEEFQAHYPGGYRMDFVGAADVMTHEALNKAFALNQEHKKRDDSMAGIEAEYYVLPRGAHSFVKSKDFFEYQKADDANWDTSKWVKVTATSIEDARTQASMLPTVDERFPSVERVGEQA